MNIRLNKYVQEKFGISRRKFINLIDLGYVFIDNKMVESYSYVLEGGETLSIKNLKVDHKIVLSNNVDIIIFNKPIGFVCSKDDKHNKTIYEILPTDFKNYFYIGRLDKDSRGLLILTNNSSLVDKFQHPSNNVEKEYLVQIDRNFSSNDYKKMRNGILDEGDLLRVKAAKNFEDKKKFFIKIILLEGKKRHIRRILNNLGYKILDLQRIREGKFELGNLKEGNRIRVKDIQSLAIG